MAITCGNCTTRNETVKHATVQDVRECYFDGFVSPEARDAYYEWEMESERQAEAAAERFWEEGTWQQQMQYQWEVEQDEARAAMMGGGW